MFPPLASKADHRRRCALIANRFWVEGCGDSVFQTVETIGSSVRIQTHGMLRSTEVEGRYVTVVLSIVTSRVKQAICHPLRASPTNHCHRMRSLLGVPSDRTSSTPSISACMLQVIIVHRQLWGVSPPSLSCNLDPRMVSCEYVYVS